MKQEILKKICLTVKQSDFDIYPEEGAWATDIREYEMKTEKCYFNITIQVWVKDNVVTGLELEDIEFTDFVVFNKYSDEKDIYITQQEFRENVNLY